MTSSTAHTAPTHHLTTSASEENVTYVSLYVVIRYTGAAACRVYVL